MPMEAVGSIEGECLRVRRCGHCKNLAPAYSKVADSLVGIVNIAAIDCDAGGTTLHSSTTTTHITASRAVSDMSAAPQMQTSSCAHRMVCKASQH